MENTGDETWYGPTADIKVADKSVPCVFGRYRELFDLS